MANVLQLVIGIFIVAILAAALLPVAFTAMFTANTTAWDSSTVTIWNILPIIFIITILVGVLALAGLKMSGKI